MKTNWAIGVKVLENRGRCKSAFEFIESGLAVGRPVELLAFSEKGSNGRRDAGISFNEAAVEVGKAEEDLDFLNVGRSGSVLDSGDMIGVHGNTVGGYNEAQEGE